MKKLLAAVTVLVVSSVAEAGAIRYVDDDAPGGGDGLSWATAYRFLQDALVEASDPGNGVLFVRVAQGTYFPDESNAVPGGNGNSGATFEVTGGLVLAGGYAGIGAQDPDARDVGSFETTLSGDLDGNGMPGGEDAWHVVTIPNAFPLAVVIDAFTIRDGRSDTTGGGSAGLRHLGGAFVVSRCPPESPYLINSGLHPMTTILWYNRRVSGVAPGGRWKA